MTTAQKLEPSILVETDDFVRPLGAAQPHRFRGTVEARPLPHVVAFPIQVSGESYYRYEKVAKRRMREFVEHALRGILYDEDADALDKVVPQALASAGRDLTRDETALMTFAIRDYRLAQEAARVHRPGRLF